MNKKTIFEEKLKDFLLSSELIIDELVKEIKWDPWKTSENDKEKIILEIRNGLKTYLEGHFIRTFHSVYNKNNSTVEGNKLIINLENYNSFDLTPEQKNNIRLDVFSVPRCLVTLLADKAFDLWSAEGELNVNQVLRENLQEAKQNAEQKAEIAENTLEGQTGSLERIREPFIKKAAELYCKHLESNSSFAFTTGIQLAIDEVSKINPKFAKELFKNQYTLKTYCTSWRKKYRIVEKREDPQKHLIKMKKTITALEEDNIPDLSFYREYTQADIEAFFRHKLK